MFKNQRIFYWSCFLFLCFSSSLSAQTGPEICDDGLDNDGDGLIDCYDPDCCGDAACEATFYDPCDIPATCIGPTIPTTFSIRNDRSSNAGVAPIIETAIPFVGDLDNDEITDYVAVSQAGPAYIFRDGVNGLTHIRTLYGGTVAPGFALPTTTPTVLDFAIETDPYPAIGDLDGDGQAEVIVRQRFNDDYHLCVYSAAGALLAFYNLDAGTSPFTYQGFGNLDNRTGTTGIYDFDGDGVAEISHGLGIFRYNPNGAGSRLELLGYPAVVDGRGLNNNYYGEQVVAVDVDNPADPGFVYGLELIAGNTVYNVDASTPTSAITNNGVITTDGTAWSITTERIASHTTTGSVIYPDGYSSVVDWDDDNLLDVVVTSNRGGNSFIYIWNPRTAAVMAETTPIVNDTPNVNANFNRNISRASVTDFDNDGELEIVVTTSLNFRIFESSLLSTINGLPRLVQGASLLTTDQSGSTTCTAFDFNYDGFKEIVYRDESNLRIFNYDGTSLTEVATSPCFSGTVVEYPIVADVDNDGQAEIVCTCKPTEATNPAQAVVTVFESGNFPWADTRRVWNQHAYFYANVNDDLKIPKNQQNHALPHSGAALVFPGQINSFLHQHADTVFRLPNAVLSNLTWNCDENSITVEVCNDGDNTLPLGMPITVYGGDPTSSSVISIGSALLGTNIDPSNPNTCVTVNIPLTHTFSSATAIYVMLNADVSTPTSFDLANYTPPETVWECDYTDNIGNFMVYPKPTIGINASVPNPVCQSRPVVLTATSSSNSISSLVWDPATVGTTNPVTVTPTTVGTETYAVTVTDENGCSGTNSIDIEVEECCPIADDPSYFHLTANTDAALLAQYKIIPVPTALSVGGVTRYLMKGLDGYHSLPNRVYIDDGIVLEVRGDGAVLDLVNSDIVFGECARMEILNGGELKAYNTVFRPCNEATSWGGVIFTVTAGEETPAPIGNIRECTFINADVGLHLGHFAEGGYTRVLLDQTISDITIQDNLFSNCKRGIEVNNLGPSQAISGNDFEIDNVDNITFHELTFVGNRILCNLVPATDNNYVGIQLRSGVNNQNVRSDYALNIHQNTFINATPVGTSPSEYIGIRSARSIAQLEISANNFTNMFQSISLDLSPSHGNRFMTVESNEINVTRRLALNNTIGSAQIVVTNGIDIEIFNNKLSCSADAPALVVLADQDAAFMQSAISIDNSSHSTVRDNTIEGFEVGIYVHQVGNWNNRLMKVADNKIKSNYYGIFLDSELNQPNLNPSENAYIQCNEIEMDLERSTTSVGIAVHFNGNITSATNHYISGNCIKHTYRAIEIVNHTLISARMPTVLNNYLYNYIEAGISIDGEFNRVGTTPPSIGHVNAATFAANNDFGGHNTFISNNENNAFDIFATAGTIEAVNNDYGTNGTAVIDNVLGNVDIVQGNEVQYPSFAKCANQDASFAQDASNNLGSSFNVYACGEDNLFTNANILFRTNTAGAIVLQANYTQAIQDVVADNEGGLLYGLTEEALNNLSNQADKDALYTAVVNTGLLTTNQAAWLSYGYESNQGNYVTAKQVVQSIQGETADENELKAISLINMDLFTSSRSVQELTRNEIQILKDIDDRRGVYAVAARTMVDVAIGKHPYLFAPYPLSKPLNSKSISRSDFTTASLTIYPNPTNDAINIDFVVTEGSDQVLNIYNATGKLIKSVSTKAMVGKLTVDVAGLAQGMYIATLKSENGNVQSGKFVKQ